MNHQCVIRYIVALSQFLVARFEIVIRILSSLYYVVNSSTPSGGCSGLRG